MSETRDKRLKVFTIVQANAALPLVRAIATDLAALAREVLERKERLAHLLNGREPERSDPYRSELAEAEAELERDNQRLHEYVEELRDLGVEPKNALDGLLDFPATIDGRLVYLCWKLGEPEVLYWHELDAGFIGRQPLVAGSVGGSGDALG